MARVLIWIGAIVVLVLLAWAALHVFITPVHPEQLPPSGHPSSACWACHFVTTSADVQQP